MFQFARTILPAILTTRLPVVVVGWLTAGAVAFADTPSFSPPLTRASAASSPAPQVASPDENDSPDQIAQWIEGLGSPSFATRLRCRQRLARAGLVAFDQLRDARNHPDNEIAIVAAQLTSSLEVLWTDANDSKRVRELLQEYGSRSQNARRQRIEELASLPREESFEPLIRLTRFEANRGLGRMAAIAAMAGRPGAEMSPLFLGDDGNQRHLQAAAIDRVIAADDDLASDWLRQYATDLRNGRFHADGWRTILNQSRRWIDDELGGAESSHEGSSGENRLRPDEVLRLAKTCAQAAQRDGQMDAALTLIVDHIDLIPPQTRNLVETAVWALDRGFYPAVIAMRSQFPAEFNGSPLLLYAAAESFVRTDQADLAEQLAETALRINPLEPLASPRDDDDDDGGNGGGGAKPAKVMNEMVVRERIAAHLQIATDLYERGLFQWAEREFRTVIDSIDIKHAYATVARMAFATMLADLNRHQDVVDVLEPLADRIEKDDQMKKQIQNTRYGLTQIRSLLDYHRGLAQTKNQQIVEARVNLKAAFRADQTNIDILIAMHRLPSVGDESDGPWRDYVQDQLAQATARAENEVLSASNGLRLIQRRVSDQDFANKLNNYAWLVCNTEGDMAKALRYSELSLVKSPNYPAYMDTCALCYFVNGDVPAAVAMQQRAIELMPHSPPLRRQLERFQTALDAQEPAAADDGS